jgi:hypothetical protein
MAVAKEEVEVAGFTVVIATGEREQTVNVCRSGRSPGDYRQVYRSNVPGNWVRAGGLIRMQSLDELNQMLIDRGYVAKGART